jgi:hypothetical protein
MSRSGAFFRPLDAALLLLVSAAAAWGFLAFRVTAGAKAIVYIADAKYAWYDLAGEKRTVELPTRIGPIKLEVGDGAARIISSPCPNKICVKTGRVAHVHEEIVCVPAHLLVVIEGSGGGSKAGVDAITY